MPVGVDGAERGADGVAGDEVTERGESGPPPPPDFFLRRKLGLRNLSCAFRFGHTTSSPQFLQRLHPAHHIPGRPTPTTLPQVMHATFLVLSELRSCVPPGSSLTIALWPLLSASESGSSPISLRTDGLAPASSSAATTFAAPSRRRGGAVVPCGLT